MLNSVMRQRIDAINELVANHRGDQERGQFKVTPYDVVKKGFIPEEYEAEFKEILRAEIDQTDESPLTLQEQLSYATYFAMHPEKVCGIMEVTTSGGFPIKVKGTRQDVERVINATLGEAIKKEELVGFLIDNVELDTSNKRLLILSFLVVIANKNYPKSMSFILDENGKGSIGKDGYLNWNKIYESSADGWAFRTNIDKDIIRKYLDSPQIKELLKGYYPNSSSQEVESSEIGNIATTGIVEVGRKPCLHIVFEDFSRDGRVEMNIELKKDNTMKFVSDGIAATISGFTYSYETRRLTGYIDADLILEYLENPQIKEFLTDYYPKSDTARERRIKIFQFQAQAYAYAQNS
jgi:hypothetical protein